jgi:hypothetical protein
MTHIGRREHRGNRGGIAVPTTRVHVRIVDVSERGARVRVTEDGPEFWIPLGFPSEWEAPPTVGAQLAVTVPRWLAERHAPIRALRSTGQRSLSFHSTELDPVKATGDFPMTDFPEDIGDGALFKNRDKTKPSQPDYVGRAKIEGRELRVAAWIRESKKNPGQKYMALSFREIVEQPAKPEVSGAGWREKDEAIPFGPAR